MHEYMRRTAVLVALLAVVLASAAAAPARSQDLGLERRASLELQVARELNQVRAARGLSKLRVQPGLRAAATGHTRSMLSAGFFAHESPDGTPFHNRIRKHYPARGWGLWSVGETLLSSGGQLDARAIVAAWLASPSHRDVVLSRGWREVGIGAFLRSDSAATQALAVTADFGLREK